MKNTHQIFLISDSTGETLDRIFMALKAQFNNFNYELNQFSFTRTESQISTILKNAKKQDSPIILYTVVNSKLAKYLAEEANKISVPCFGVLGDLILNFSKILNQKATHKPSGQHVLDEEYYKRIEAIQFTMNHDDGNRLNSLKEKEASDYTDLEKIKIEVEQSKKIFKKNKWPTIDVTRKSVEETAASIIKIYEIKNKNV